MSSTVSESNPTTGTSSSVTQPSPLPPYETLLEHHEHEWPTRTHDTTVIDGTALYRPRATALRELPHLLDSAPYRSQQTQHAQIPILDEDTHTSLAGGDDTHLVHEFTSHTPATSRTSSVPPIHPPNSSTTSTPIPTFQLPTPSSTSRSSRVYSIWNSPATSTPTSPSSTNSNSRLTIGLENWLSQHSPFSPTAAAANKARLQAHANHSVNTTSKQHEQHAATSAITTAAGSSTIATPAAVPSASANSVSPPATASVATVAASSSTTVPVKPKLKEKRASLNAIQLAEKGFAAISGFFKDLTSPSPPPVLPSATTTSNSTGKHASKPSGSSTSSATGPVPPQANGPDLTDLMSAESIPTDMQFTFASSTTNPSTSTREEVVDMHPAQSNLNLSSWHSGSELSFFDSLASYGFRTDDAKPAKIEWLSRYVHRLEEQEQAWNEVQAHLERLTPKQYKVLTRTGIPAAFRSRVWWYWLGPDELRAREPMDYYQSLQTQPELRLNAETYRNITKDVDRTFTSHPFFKDPQGEGVRSLRRILCAYALRNPQVNYCQSMNFLVAFLLLFYTEEQAFWMCAVLIESFLPDDYYSSTMIGIQADVQVLLVLIEKRLPKIWSHLLSLECHLSLEGVFTGWFLCLFIKTTPIETTLRIMDSLFVEGTKVLFRVGLALMDLHTQEILACDDFGSLFQYFNSLGSEEYDCDRLLTHAFSFRGIKRTWLAKERSKQFQRLRQIYEEMEMKRRESFGEVN